VIGGDVLRFPIYCCVPERVELHSDGSPAPTYCW
jgi:hypothetical protein